MCVRGKEPKQLKTGSSFSALESEGYCNFSSQRRFLGGKNGF